MTEAAADARSTYERGREAHGRRIAALERRAQALGAARLVVAAAILALLGLFAWTRLAWAWPATALLAVVFATLVGVHARVEREKERALAAHRFHARGLARLSLDWASLPATSERLRSADHPFSGDLDVFGKASLMQIVDGTETRFGEERLAALLAAQTTAPWPQETLERAEGARELATRTAFRERLAVAAGVLAAERPDPSALLIWTEQKGAVSRGLALAAWVVPAASLALVVAAAAGVLAAGTTTALAALLIAAGLAASARVSASLDWVSAREQGVTRWQETMQCVESEPFASPRLARLRARLGADGRSASAEMAALDRIVGFADARRNEVFRFFIGPLLMWDVHCAIALEGWRGRIAGDLRGWFDALAEIDALASLGAFAFEHPDFAWPELAVEPAFEARGLAHPLLAADRRVGNDVSIPCAGRVLVVTGSNMSGKSTLLRAIGVNAVLAAAGAPVCARWMRVGPLRVATSMRVEDSLERGVSHFYAELTRLKRIVDAAADGAQKPPDGFAVLFLLDEILHGTNSRERILGAVAVVRELLAYGALGAISTHDLGITRMESDPALAGRVQNVHFEEQVAGAQMSFDYVLRPGVVQSSNALRLMQALGIAVGADAVGRDVGSAEVAAEGERRKSDSDEHGHRPGEP